MTPKKQDICIKIKKHIVSLNFIILPDTLMDSTESFEDNLSSIFNELFGIVSKEKIVGKHSFTFGQIILSFFEIKLHIQALKKY